MTSDPITEDVWREHRMWVRVHLGREQQRQQWRDRDWELARQVADTRWERVHGTYLWQALKGVEQAHWCFARRRLK